MFYSPDDKRLYKLTPTVDNEDILLCFSIPGSGVFMKSSRRIPRSAVGDECGGGQGGCSPLIKFFEMPCPLGRVIHVRPVVWEAFPYPNFAGINV
jgi:hypothetical protein